MPRGMLVLSIARGVIERRRRCVTAKGPVVTDISPDVARDGLAPGQDRHGGVVAMQPLGSQDVALDQRMQRLQDRRAGLLPFRPARYDHRYAPSRLSSVHNHVAMDPFSAQSGGSDVTIASGLDQPRLPILRY
jgi:hypothetical protein